MTEDAAIDRLKTHTLYRGSALYTHHGTHGLTLPIEWTNGVPTKPIYCHDTLPATPTNSPLGQVMGGPVPTKGINGHRRGKTLNGPKRGQWYTNINNGHTRLMSAYLIRVARAHNLSSLEAPARGMTIDPVRTFP